MSIIYLKHPVHGCKVATLEPEAVYDESHGWVRYTPEAPSDDAPDAAEAPQDPDIPNFLAPRRRGRLLKTAEGSQPWPQPEN